MIYQTFNFTPRYKWQRADNMPDKTRLRLLEKERDALVIMGRAVPPHINTMIDGIRGRVG